VLLSHLGRPKGGPDPQYSLKQIVRDLENLLGAPVEFIPDPPPESHDASAATRQRRAGREHALSGPARRRMIPSWRRSSPRSAISTWTTPSARRIAHTRSTEAVAHLLKPAVAGFLMEKELTYLGQLLSNPRHPFIAVLGGAKISGKIDVIRSLLPRVDELLIGGAMACNLFRGHGARGRRVASRGRIALRLRRSCLRPAAKN